ncbi:MAG: alginate lyase family protein [Melioribacteraceae bacterium]|nr:alginate lyase family protein [Melioribacteraceae bacterium]
MRKLFIVFWAICIVNISTSGQSSHPNLVITGEDAANIKVHLGSVPLFDKSLQLAKDFVESAMNSRIDVPYPKDPGGGYTHERHKQNYNEMYNAGILYSVTGDERYAVFIKSMLDEYAELYPQLGRHPQGKKQTPGRMFWQSLNETVWLLHTIQAYDCIYDWLSESDRNNYEQNIFIPMSEFFINECTHEFDLIHNHGTWIVAAVGMAGYVIGNDDYVEMALHGSKKDGKSGFIAQLDNLFSPDGYYTEGGYYVRYALWPFFIFAEVIHNNQPELEIYNYRDQILKKALYSALQVTYTDGTFIPINDALKEKTWLSPELIFATNFVYAHYGQDRQLLSIVKLHDQVSLTGPGMMAARDLSDDKPVPEFNWKSVEYTDGPEGNMGGVGILRYGTPEDQETLLMKYGSHGLSHGHFDKLTFCFYDQAREIIQDYGAARFLNVEQKFGGRYLEENNTYAKQTVAHNTVVVDQKSQFSGIRSESEKYHAYRYCFNSDKPDFQYVSAKEDKAYPGVNQHRTMILVNDDKLYRPVVIDVYRINSGISHEYDLPFYYMGHFIYSNFRYDAYTKQRSLMGDDNGYQHLWKEAMGKPDSTSQLTWWNGKRFYSLTINTSRTDEIYFTRIGGSDPEFNLRNEPGFIVRKRDKNTVFVSVLEPHGIFDPTLEFTKDSYSTFKDIIVLSSDEKYTAVNIKGNNNINWIITIANADADPGSQHELSAADKILKWTGPVAVHK